MQVVFQYQCQSHAPLPQPPSLDAAINQLLGGVMSTVERAAHSPSGQGPSTTVTVLH